MVAIAARDVKRARKVAKKYKYVFVCAWGASLDEGEFSYSSPYL